MAAPPSDAGAVNTTVAIPTPGVTELTAGAPGTVGATVKAEDAAVPVPAFPAASSTPARFRVMRPSSVALPAVKVPV